MKKWLQRIRGALGMGLTWAVGWFGVGAIVGLVGNYGLFGLAFSAAIFAVMGFVGGAAFSVVLGIAEGRRRFDQMSLWRFAAWGAVGGLLLYVPMGEGALTVGIVTLLGAGSAAGSLALARRAEDRELLEAGEEALGLTEGG